MEGVQELDAFFSHCTLANDFDRSNYGVVVELANLLERRFRKKVALIRDKDGPERRQGTRGDIQRAKVVVVFLTREYVKCWNGGLKGKHRQAVQQQCLQELQITQEIHGNLSTLIVCLDRRVRDAAKWGPALSEALGTTQFLDLSKDRSQKLEKEAKLLNTRMEVKYEFPLHDLDLGLTDTTLLPRLLPSRRAPVQCAASILAGVDVVIRKSILEEVLKWAMSNRSWKPLFVLCAPAGAGKSVLSSQLIQGDLPALAKTRKSRRRLSLSIFQPIRPKVGAAHFFTSACTDFTSVILSILNQLAPHIPGLARVVLDSVKPRLQELMRLSPGEFFSVAFLDVCQKACRDDYIRQEGQGPTRLVVILDAIDDAPADVYRTILGCLQPSILAAAPRWLGFFVTQNGGTGTQREDAGETSSLLRSLATKAVVYNVPSSRTEEDLRQYWQQRLKKLVPSRDLTNAAEVLKARAAGSFLYCRLMEPSLLKSRKRGSVPLKALRDESKFPSSLEHAIMTAFTSFKTQCLSDNKQAFEALLAPLVVSRVPVPKSVLQQALESSTKLADVLQFAESKSLFIEESADSVRLAHPSLAVWLLNEEYHSVMDFSLNELSAHCKVADICDKRFDSCSFAASQQLYHLCGAQRWEQARSLLINHEKLLSIVRRGPGTNLAQQLFEDAMMSEQLVATCPDGAVLETVEQTLQALEAAVRSPANTCEESFDALLFALRAYVQDPEAQQVLSSVKPLKNTILPKHSLSSGSIVGDCRRVFRGREDESFTAVALTNRHVIAASSDNSIRIWSRVSGRCLRVLTGHTKWIRSLALQGNLLASASDDRTVKLWDFHSGICLNTLRGHASWVRAVALNDDVVVSGSDDNSVRVWDWSSGEQQLVLEGHRSYVRAVAIAEHLVASASDDKSIRLWDRTLGICIRELPPQHSRAVTCLAMQGSTLVAGSQDKTLSFWNYKAGLLLQTFVGHAAEVNAVDFDDQGYVYSSSEDGSLKIWDSESSQCLATFGSYTGIKPKALVASGQQTVAAFDDGSVRLWHFPDRFLQKVDLHHSSIAAIGWGGEDCVSASLDGVVNVWDVQSNKVDCRLESGEEPVCVMDDRFIASGSKDGVLRVWDRVNGELLFRLESDRRKPVLSLALENETLVSGRNDGSLCVWDLGAGQLVQTLRGHRDGVCSVAIHGGVVASGCVDASLRIWGSGSGKSLFRLRGHQGAIHLLAMHGEYIVSGSYDLTARVWNRVSGNCLHVLGPFHQDPLIAVDVRHAALFVVSTSSLKIWDRKTAKMLRDVTFPSALQNRFIVAAIDPDRSRFAMGDKTGAVAFLTF